MMKTIFFSLCIAGSLLCILGCAEDREDRIREAVQSELRLHPRARLLDLYKFFFQDAFGPAHIVPDRSAARRYLEEELAEAAQFEAQPWQALGYRQRYYRLNLSLVRDNIVPQEILLDALVRSANHGPQTDLAHWKTEWSQILKVIADMNPNLLYWEQDRRFLSDLLAQDQYVIHHSRDYIEHYDPHYRIISRSEFRRIRRRFLQKQGSVPKNSPDE